MMLIRCLQTLQCQGALWAGGPTDIGKVFRYRPGVAQRVGRGIALLFHDCGA